MQKTYRGCYSKNWGFPSGSVAENSLVSAGVTRDAGLIPELGRSPRGGSENPLLYSWLENSMDRGVWWATVIRMLGRACFKGTNFPFKKNLIWK